MKLTEEQMKTTYPYDLILSRLRSGYYMAVSAKKALREMQTGQQMKLPE